MNRYLRPSSPYSFGAIFISEAGWIYRAGPSGIDFDEARGYGFIRRERSNRALGDEDLLTLGVDTPTLTS